MGWYIVYTLSVCIYDITRGLDIEEEGDFHLSDFVSNFVQ